MMREQFFGFFVEFFKCEAHEKFLDESPGGESEGVTRQEDAHLGVEAQVVERAGKLLLKPK